MFAVIVTGGKQYKVTVGQVIDVEKIDAEVGAEVSIDKVLLVVDNDKITHGAPQVTGATVTAKVVRQERGPKLIVYRYRAKSRYRRKTGHRQSITKLLINAINA